MNEKKVNDQADPATVTVGYTGDTPRQFDERVRIAESEKQGDIDTARAAIFDQCKQNGGNIFTYHQQLTDTGAAERFAVVKGAEVRYCDPWKKWIVWDGRRWKIDDINRLTRMGKEVTRWLYSQALKIPDDNARQAHIAYVLRGEQHSKIRAMQEILKSEVPIVPDELDQNTWKLNVKNGTIDLHTGELLRHNRSDFITKLAPVKYDENATCPTWLRFLKEIMAGETDMIVLLQQIFGYILTADTREQKVFILHGTGANGKSTLVETWAALLGDYGTQTPTETLLIKRNQGIPNDIARLAGARFVYAVEADQGRRLSESLIKQLTGGDTITARFLHAEFFRFVPTFKVLLSTNHRPTIWGTDHAIWRRICLLPFTVRIPDDEQDKGLKDKLKKELPGILNWAIEGCLDWQKNDFFYPEQVTAATAEYKQAEDILYDFLTDRCRVDVPEETKSSILYAVYREWAEDNGVQSPVSQKTFSRLLEERDFRKEKQKNGVFWVGIGLLAGLVKG